MRIGHGYDVHALVDERPLIIGGVDIPYEQGLLGHSDADVALHALMDAILGALALGDIGSHFSDKDPKYEGADSKVLLKQVVDMMKERHYKIGNVDLTIIAQQPKLSPYIKEMQQVICDILGAGRDDVNIKATTEEHLGFTGRKEGISAHCVCLLVPEVKNPIRYV